MQSNHLGIYLYKIFLLPSFIIFFSQIPICYWSIHLSVHTYSFKLVVIGTKLSLVSLPPFQLVITAPITKHQAIYGLIISDITSLRERRDHFERSDAQLCAHTKLLGDYRPVPHFPAFFYRCQIKSPSASCASKVRFLCDFFVFQMSNLQGGQWGSGTPAMGAKH